MTFSTLASPGVSLQGGGGSGGGAASLPISGNGATVTASTPLVDGTQTWNNAAVTFTSFKLNITDTASNASSLLMDLGTGGGTFASKFSVSKAGVVTVNAATATSAANPAIALTINGSSKSGLFQTSNVFSMQVAANGVEEMSIGNGPVRVTSTRGFGWVSGASTIGAADTILTRRAAANLRFGAADAAAPVAQTLSVQSVVTGTSNIAGANLTITGSQGTGTGAGGSIIFQVAPAGSSGTAQNALSTALTINSARQVVFNNGSNIVPSICGSDDDTGIYFPSDGTISVTTTGSNRFSLDAICNVNISAISSIRWNSSSSSLVGTYDLLIGRDAANTLALRNGANNQELRVYGSYTSAAVYDRLTLKSSSTVATVAAETDAGDMDLALTPAGSGNVQFGTHAAIVAETVTGYITIKDAGGTLRKLAVVS